MRLISLEFAGMDGVVPLSPFLYRVCSGLDAFHPVRFAPASLLPVASGWIESCAISCSLLLS
jgi:hypothetical protein